MISEARLKISKLFIHIAAQEIAIEKLRQNLAAIEDFEPYTAFKRIDRANIGLISKASLCQFLKDNGFREL